MSLNFQNAKIAYVRSALIRITRVWHAFFAMYASDTRHTARTSARMGKDIFQNYQNKGERKNLNDILGNCSCCEGSGSRAAGYLGASGHRVTKFKVNEEGDVNESK